MSPVDHEIKMMEPIEPPALYEFEIPQNIVGLVIGKKGVTINKLTSHSGCHIVIREHTMKNDCKICTLEGERKAENGLESCCSSLPLLFLGRSDF